jgi:hypothetical protein
VGNVTDVVFFLYSLETTRGGDSTTQDDNTGFMRGLEIERMCVEGRELDKILDHLTDRLRGGENARRTTRLLALCSLTHGGIPAAKLETVRFSLFSYRQLD